MAGRGAGLQPQATPTSNAIVVGHLQGIRSQIMFIEIGSQNGREFESSHYRLD